MNPGWHFARGALYVPGNAKYGRFDSLRPYLDHGTIERTGQNRLGTHLLGPLYRGVPGGAYFMKKDPNHGISKILRF